MDAVAVIGLQLAQEAPTALRPVRKLFLGVASIFFGNKRFSGQGGDTLPEKLLFVPLSACAPLPSFLSWYHLGNLIFYRLSPWIYM